MDAPTLQRPFHLSGDEGSFQGDNFRSSGGSFTPSSNVLYDGYRETFSGPNGDASHYNASNTQRPHSSSRLNTSDPVAMHFLVETALGDSSHYELLAFDEVDEMKKEYATLSHRIEATRRKLALESKVRDAAASLSRLNGAGSAGASPDSSPRKHRRNLFGSKGNIDPLSKTDDELTTSSRKCEELSRELFRLEQRAMTLERKLLHHTAGILQLTHKGLPRKGPANEVPPPGSPESMYTHSNGRGSGAVYNGLDDFDERSFYHRMDGGSSGGDGEAYSQQIRATETKLGELNARLRELIVIADPEANHTFGEPSSMQLEPQLQYLEEGLNVAESQLRLLTDSARSMSSKGDKVDQFEAVLMGLWEIILSGEEEARQRKIQARQAQRQNPNLDLDDSPDDNDYTPNEEFSLQAFSAKVQRLYARATSLKDQKNILRRQIKQQRELNNRSDAEKDDELNQARDAVMAKDNELQQAIQELEQVRKEIELREQQRGMNDSQALQAEKLARQEAEEQLLDQLRQKNEELARLSAERRNLEGEIVGELKRKEEEVRLLEEKLHDTRDDAEIARAERMQLAEQLESKTKEAATTERELREIEGEVVRLQTEVTVARAELDGAYGTRAQRAAEVAANPAVQREMDELTGRNRELGARVDTLQRELAETLGEFEAMTKSSIEFEKEREALEGVVDSLRDRCESLEADLSEEKVRWLGVRSPGPAGGTPGTPGTPGGGAASENTSTTVLRTEFKKMMRDTRAEHARLLRAEQDERRKLEALVRSLKKEQHHSPGKSSLSQSISAS